MKVEKYRCLQIQKCLFVVHYSIMLSQIIYYYFIKFKVPIIIVNGYIRNMCIFDELTEKSSHDNHNN